MNTMLHIKDSQDIFKPNFRVLQGFSYHAAWGIMGRTGGGIMHADPDIWIWIYAPLFVISLCLSLIYGCFTWKNMLAWLFTLFVGQLLTDVMIQSVTGPMVDLVFGLTFALVSFCMMAVYFYRVQKRTPVKQFISFALFTATSYPVANGIFAGLLFGFGLIHC